MKKNELEPGQKFRGRDGALWELKRFADVHSAFPHVTLIGVDDPKSMKVISVSALLDQSLFSSEPQTA